MANDLTEREKDPRDYGKKKYLVEVLLTERFVVTVYADDEDEAAKRACDAPYRGSQGTMGFRCKDGVSHVHFDEDYDYLVTRREVEVDDDSEDSC
jgi:hypothetical protein